jgi:hypothetical protein
MIKKVQINFKKMKFSHKMIISTRIKYSARHIGLVAVAAPQLASSSIQHQVAVVLEHQLVGSARFRVIDNVACRIHDEIARRFREAHLKGSLVGSCRFEEHARVALFGDDEISVNQKVHVEATAGRCQTVAKEQTLVGQQRVGDTSTGDCLQFRCRIWIGSACQCRCCAISAGLVVSRARIEEAAVHATSCDRDATGDVDFRDKEWRVEQCTALENHATLKSDDKKLSKNDPKKTAAIVSSP